jgi:hypothetical protein
VVFFCVIGRQLGKRQNFIPFYAMDPELFDFHQIRFSKGETTEEAIRK